MEIIWGTNKIWCPICGKYEEKWEHMWILYIEIENWMSGKSYPLS